MVWVAIARWLKRSSWREAHHESVTSKGKLSKTQKVNTSQISGKSYSLLDMQGSSLSPKTADERRLSELSNSLKVEQRALDSQFSWVTHTWESFQWYGCPCVSMFLNTTSVSSLVDKVESWSYPYLGLISLPYLYWVDICLGLPGLVSCKIWVWRLARGLQKFSSYFLCLFIR